MVAEPWFLAAEKLLGAVAQLVDERDELAEALATADANLQDAQVRIDQLDRLNQTLRAELYELRNAKPDKRNVGVIAKAIGAILLAVPTGFGGELAKHWLGAQERAVTVQVYCGFPVEPVPAPQIVTVPSIVPETPSHEPEPGTEKADSPGEQRHEYGSYSGGYGGAPYGGEPYGGASPAQARHTAERRASDDALAADAAAEGHVISTGGADAQILPEDEVIEISAQDETRIGLSEDARVREDDAKT